MWTLQRGTSEQGVELGRVELSAKINKEETIVVDLSSHISDTNSSGSSDVKSEGMEVEIWLGYPISLLIEYHLIR